MRPIAAADVAAALADFATAPPAHGIVELGGPEPLTMDEAVRRVLAAKGDSRPVVVDPEARYFGADVNDGSLTPGANPRLGSIRLERWLSDFEDSKAT
jgi:uncharacterized protein YbjT (DUF2867 family)